MDSDCEQDRLAKLAGETQEIYDRQAVSYDQQRNKSLFERNWLERALQDVPPGGRVLDLGCGAGEPIAAWLVAQGYRVTGADFSTNMLALFASRFPKAMAVRSDMRDLDLGAQFDAIIGWGSFFHLTQDEQRHALPKIARHLAPSGRLLLTVGPGEGEALGRVGTDDVFHASLSVQEYDELLDLGGAKVEDFVPEDPHCHGFTLLLARA